MKKQALALITSPFVVLFFVACALSFFVETPQTVHAQIGQYAQENLSKDAQSQGATQNTAGEANNGYVPLVVIPGLTSPDVVNSSDLAVFWNAIYRLCIGAAVVIAIVQIIRGGLLYMVTDSPVKLGDGKAIIWQSLVGLLLVLSPVVILNTINPNITGLSVKIDPVPKSKTSINDLAPKTGTTSSEPDNGTATTTEDTKTAISDTVVNGVRIVTKGTYLRTATFTTTDKREITTFPVDPVISSWMDECSSGFVGNSAGSVAYQASGVCGVFSDPQLFVVPNATDASPQVQALPSSFAAVTLFEGKCTEDGGFAYIPKSKPRIQIRDLLPGLAFEQLDECPAEISQMNFPSYFKSECYKASMICWNSSSTDRKFLIQ